MFPVQTDHGSGQTVSNCVHGQCLTQRAVTLDWDTQVVVQSILFLNPEHNQPVVLQKLHSGFSKFSVFVCSDVLITTDLLVSGSQL